MTPRALLLVALAGAIATATALALSGCAYSATPGGDAADAPSAPGKTASGTPSPAPTIEPVIAVASVDVDGQHVTASGAVQGVVEDGGTCSFAFTHEGAETVTLENQGVADRSSTACGAVQPEIARFVRGPWSVVLTYTSPAGTFHSQPQTVEVP